MKNIFWSFFFLIISIAIIIIPTIYKNPFFLEYSIVVVFLTFLSFAYIAAFSVFFIIQNFEILRLILYHKFLQSLRESIKPDNNRLRDFGRFLGLSYFLNLFMLILFSITSLKSVITLAPIDLFTLIENNELDIRLTQSTNEAVILRLSIIISGPIFIMILRQLYRKYSTSNKERFPGSRVLFSLICILPIIILVNSYPLDENIKVAVRTIVDSSLILSLIVIIPIWILDMSLFRNKQHN